MSDIQSREEATVAQQLRVYTMKEGQLDNWVALFERGTHPLRRANGFEIQAWTAPDTNQFVWLVTRPGTREEFEAADQAYYALPEHKHKPLHEEALLYLEKGETWFLDEVAV
jgi:hypothetical protein